MKNYTMSDIGSFSQVLKHVINPIAQMLCEDYSSQYMLYTEQYRDLPVELFEEFVFDLLSSVPYDVQKKAYDDVREKAISIDYGFHEPVVMAGNEYMCDLMDLDIETEFKYLDMLLSMEYEEDYAEWKKNAIQTLRANNWSFGGVEMLRALWWCNHLSMFDYEGKINEFSVQDWNVLNHAILSEVVKHAVPLYGSADFGTKKSKGDIWQVDKWKIRSLTLVKSSGQVMESPTHFSGKKTKVKRVDLAPPGNIWRKEIKKVTFIFEQLPNPDKHIEMGELTSDQIARLRREERAMERLRK